jgi:hypothetical protein
MVYPHLNCSTPVALALAGFFLAAAGEARAHCDTLGGPVIAAAQLALEKGEVTPVLKWVRAQDEGEIRDLFARTLAVRRLGPEAQKLADFYFFETLVRIHRAGEGFGYTGLKPGAAVEPAVALADQALASGSSERLTEELLAHAKSGLLDRFQRVFEAKQHADESVAAGRAFVAAYVEYTHYALNLASAIDGAGGHHAEAEGAGPTHQH